MTSIVLITIVVLSVVGPTFAIEENELVMLKAMLCDEDMQEIGDKIEKCFDVVESPSEFEAMAQECCPSLSIDASGAEIREWYCEHDQDAVMQCMTCQEERIKESGKEEKMEEAMKPLEECMKNYFPSEEK